MPPSELTVIVYCSKKNRMWLYKSKDTSKKRDSLCAKNIKFLRSGINNYLSHIFSKLEIHFSNGFMRTE